MNADMGQLTALTIVLALALDFLFLPTLLMMTVPKRGELAKSPVEPDRELVVSASTGSSGSS
jgi:hypothetical protein